MKKKNEWFAVTKLASALRPALFLFTNITHLFTYFRSY